MKLDDLRSELQKGFCNICNGTGLYAGYLPGTQLACVYCKAGSRVVQVKCASIVRGKRCSRIAKTYKDTTIRAERPNLINLCDRCFATTKEAGYALELFP